MVAGHILQGDVNGDGKAERFKSTPQFSTPAISFSETPRSGRQGSEAALKTGAGCHRRFILRI
jgi:hypothetical protein